MEFIDFLKSVLPGTVIQLLAAVAGSYFLWSAKRSRIDKWFVIYLWVVFIFEMICWYPAIAYFSDYTFLSFVENSPFSRNFWLHNCFLPLSHAFLAYYFSRYIHKERVKKILVYGIFIYLLVGFGYLFFSGDFFTKFSLFSMVGGSLLIVTAVAAFFFELLQSDIILKLKFYLPMYIAVGVLVFYLCVTPVDLFSIYFKEENDIFVNLRVQVLLYTNLFMYLMFAIGFLVCSRKK